MKVEMDSKGRRLGVGGFASRERQVISAFCSAAIAKRHDTVTLEAADGIRITITGFINRCLSFENGFSSEVCNHFIFGFPYYWEEYVGRCLSEESVNKAIPLRISRLNGFNMTSDDGTDSSLPISFDDLPVTRVRDLIMSNLGDSGNCVVAKSILNVIMQKYGGDAFKYGGAPVQSNMQRKCAGMTLDSVPDGTPSNCKKTMCKQKRKDDYGIHPLMTGESVHNGTPKNHNKTKVQQKSKVEIIPEYGMGVEVNSLSRRVTPRSMTRFNKLRNKQEKNLSPNTSVTHRLTKPVFTSGASRNQCGVMVNRGSASSVSHAIILSNAEVEANETPDCTTVRRPNRLKSSIDPFSTPDSSKNLCGGLVSSRKGSDVCHAYILSGEEMDVRQTYEISAVRRSKRLRNTNK